MSASCPVSGEADAQIVARAFAALTEDAPAGHAIEAELVRPHIRCLAPLRSEIDIERLVQRVLDRVHGLGPVERLLRLEGVAEVMVNGPGPVWIEQSGVTTATDVVLDRAGVELLVERIVGPLGLRVDRSSPLVDARLADGSRVNIIVPPLAVDGPYITIRRFAAVPHPLAAFGSEPLVELLRWAVRHRANIVVSGGTGSGKTSLLNALAGEIPSEERVVTVEDAAELRLPGSHVVRLEARPPNAEGVGAVSIRALVRNALRMRPDRIVVGEVRGGEALDMVQAMNTGHEGSLSTCHANSGADALHRLETMVLLADVGLPLGAVREHLRSAVDVVVHVARRDGGRRQVMQVLQVGLAEPVTLFAGGKVVTCPSPLRDTESVGR